MTVSEAAWEQRQSSALFWLPSATDYLFWVLLPYHARWLEGEVVIMAGAA